MIVLQATRILKTDSKALLSSILHEEEGEALVFVKEDGELKVRPSLGVAGEIFAGFSYARALPPSMLVKVEEFTIPSTGIVELQRTPIEGNMLVKIAGVAVAAADIGADAAAPDAAGKVNKVGDTLYFHADDADKAGSIQYMYEPTVSEAREVTGDAPINEAVNNMGRVGFIRVGTVGLTNFDASVDWTNVINPRLGPGGILTASGDGVLLSNVVVDNSPTTDQDYLIVSISNY